MIGRKNIKIYLKNKKIISYALLWIGCSLILSLLWGVNIIGADDAFIAMDSFRKGGLFKASLLQAQGQGRHFYIVAWTLTQLSYLGDSTVWLSIIRIITNLIVAITFFRLIKNIFNENIAILTGFLTLALFLTVDADFNSFYATPLWYSVGIIFLFLSFNSYHLALIEKKSQYLSFLYYFICLHFYESMLLYAPVFLAIHLVEYLKCKQQFLMKDYLGDFFSSLKWLFIFLILYILIYFMFRYFFPSQYEGAKTLNFTTLGRTIKTIYLLSFYGIQTQIYLRRPVDGSWYAFYLTVITFFGTWLCLKKKKKLSLDSKYFRIIFGTVFLTTLYLIVAPNILYGFVDKYHSWSDALRYYNGSFYSAFAYIVLISLILYTILDIIQNDKIRNITILIICFIIGFFSYSNAIKTYPFLANQKLLASRWVLVPQIIEKASSELKENDTICTSNLYRKDDSFDIYNYWSEFFSKYTQKKIKVQYVEGVNSDCQWSLNYDLNFKRAQLELTKIKQPEIKYSAIKEF